MCQPDRPHREEADDDENPWNAAIHWGLWLRYERRLLVSHDPVFLRFAKTFFTQSCFGCGADLELERSRSPDTLCTQCRSSRAWRLN